MIELITLLLPVLLLIAILNGIRKRIKKRSKINKLDKEIHQKEQELIGLSSEVDNTKFSNSNGHSKIQLDVLELYQDSNIKIPTEILDDLHYNNIQDYREIYVFIENQRNFWKLENSKKPYLKGMKK